MRVTIEGEEVEQGGREADRQCEIDGLAEVGAQGERDVDAIEERECNLLLQGNQMFVVLGQRSRARS